MARGFWADTIKFAIPGDELHIFPGVLPTITDDVEIDGWSQGGPGYTGPPLIVVDGSADQVRLQRVKDPGRERTVRGLVITDTGPFETALPW